MVKLAVAICLMLFVANLILLHKFYKSTKNRPIKHKWRRSDTAVKNGSIHALLTPSEMQHVLDNRNNYNGQIMKSTDDETIDPERIPILIRSRLTRPDPSKPVRLGGSNSSHVVEHFSEVGSICEIIYDENDYDNSSVVRWVSY